MGARWRCPRIVAAPRRRSCGSAVRIGRKADPRAAAGRAPGDRLARHQEVEAMERQAVFQDVQQRIAELFRSSPAADLERNVKAMLAQSFQRMDLVTREEFEVQLETVARLRARVEALEARLADAAPPKD
jgi:BMFP domain-containing protein YqiC